MRTKALLLTAAFSAVGLASSMAQTAVYSVNAVGFVKLTIPVGLSMISNPLDNKAANGNTISNLFAAAPDDTTLYPFGPTTTLPAATGFSPNQKSFGDWSRPTDLLEPGAGVFIQNVSNAPFDIIFVGDVKQGDLSNPLPQGLSIRSSQVPQAGALQTALGYTPQENDTIFQFDNSINNYKPAALFQFDAWNAEPVVGVGEAFWLQKDAASTWTRTFHVSPQ
jgi:hypothetical protein